MDEQTNNEIIKRLDLHISISYEKIMQCQYLINEYTTQKKKYEDDYMYGQTLRQNMINELWQPPKNENI